MCQLSVIKNNGDFDTIEKSHVWVLLRTLPCIGVCCSKCGQPNPCYSILDFYTSYSMAEKDCKAQYQKLILFQRHGQVGITEVPSKVKLKQFEEIRF